MAVQTLQRADVKNALKASPKYPKCHITYNRDTWVTLLELPSEYSYHEAKLLCKESEDTWVAWVPDHGEAVLRKDQFYC